MTIARGEIYGFLGRNGAGKTTTLRLILGLLHPTAGQVELFGEPVTPAKRPPFERIGSIIEFPGFYPNLTAAENLDLHRRLMGLSRRDAIEETLDKVGLLHARNRQVKTLSLGMKQRLGIGRALLHHPELLILDEPTNGLDPVGIKEVRQLILDLAQRSKITVLISSHILTEIELLATKVGFIHRGRLLEEVAYDDLLRKNRSYVELRVSDDKRASLLLEQRMDLQDYLIPEQGVLRLYERLTEASAVNRLLIEHGVDVQELRVVRETLEDYFVRLTGGDLDVPIVAE